MNHPPLHDLLVDWARDQRRGGQVKNTIRQRAYRIRALAGWLETHRGRRHVLAATAENIADWLDTLPGRAGDGITPATQRNVLGMLQAFYLWAQAAGHVQRNPVDGVAKPQVGRRLPRPADDEVLDAAMTAADARMLLILSLMAYEGLRCCEVSRLRWEDINIGKMTLRVVGKGNKERIVPLHPMTLEAARRYGIRTQGAVIVRRTNPGRGTAPLTPESTSRLVNGFLPRGTSAHQLRHWFGTNFYNESGDLLLTAEVMGHAYTSTTQGYAKVNTKRAQKFVAKLNIGAPTTGSGAIDLTQLDLSDPAVKAKLLELLLNAS